VEFFSLSNIGAFNRWLVPASESGRLSDLQGHSRGLNMRLTAGGSRELDWQEAAEWALMLTGTRANNRDR
jgi:hypothetical protein